MKPLFLALLIIGSAASPAMAGDAPQAAGTADSIPVRPGLPGARPFWNRNARRFIYAPAFDLPKVARAAGYRFTIHARDGRTLTFTAPEPTAPLSPIWDEVIEGLTTLDVEGIDAAGRAIGASGERVFYRSPGFSGDAGAPPTPYLKAGQWGLRGIFEAPYVQHWLSDDKPDRAYARYCYPDKIIGGLVRAACAFATAAPGPVERDAARRIGTRAADYLLSLRLPDGSPYAHLPPSYAVNVDRPTRVAVERVEGHWLMVPQGVDAAFGFLDLYDLTSDRKYFDAATAIADTLATNQGADGTWPLMVDDRTGKPLAAQRLIPTWPIFLFDRLDRQYHLESYQSARERAWRWIRDNPLKTYQWDAQFEDVILRDPYANLAREQACDVAMLLMSDPRRTADDIALAEELLRFAEDQFVVWAPVRDVAGWRQAMPQRRRNCDIWITPCVLEQYACYDPVARSAAILIKAYLKAHAITHKAIYLRKAQALGNGMVAGQEWQAEHHAGNGEIPTWNMRRPPINWLNTSYYAAEALLNLARDPVTVK